MLSCFAIEIRCSAPTLDELCERARGRFAELLRERRSICEDFHTAWEQACGSLTQNGFGEEEAELLRELGKSLGTSDAAGQLKLLELNEERIAALYSSAEADYAAKGKLFRSVGMLCGIGAAILII